VHQATGMLSPNLHLAGRYLIAQRLGRGGMAAVYQAQDMHLPGHVCAIKEMSDASLTTTAERQQAIANFQHEAQILARLNHPNIVRVSDFFEHDAKYYLVMDYVDGCTLEDLLEQHGHAFGEPEVLPWLHQLCDALAFLHRQQPPIIFRDLKPGNIMVDRQGVLKLIDFGIARRFDPTKGQDTQRFGTEGYAPPEQYGKGQTDARSDIYALGVTAHRLLTGFDPSTSPFNLPSVRTINRGVSPVIGDLVDRCVQTDLLRRPQRMDEVQAVVTGALTGGLPPGLAAVLTGGSSAPPVQTSKRPTTRLVQAAAQLTTKQLAAGAGGVLAAIVIGIWLFGPWLRTNAPALWYGLPAFMIAGPIAYAATRRIGLAFVSQVVITLVVWLTAWVRLGGAPADYTGFLLGTLLSALAYEVSFFLLGQLTAWRRHSDDWWREMAWYAVTAIVATAFFFVPWHTVRIDSMFMVWLGAALVGAAGWFVGDLIKEGIIQRYGVRFHP